MNKIIILIPHFNNVNGLKLSLLSIDESFFIDILIVDDGSKDKPELLELEKVYTKGKIFIEYLSFNQGIEKALNQGLKIIKDSDYEYIGRLDCGDFCKKNKFRKQLKLLDEDREIALLGSWANVIDERGKLLYILKHPASFKKIKNIMYVNSAFVHPTVVFRKRVIDQIGFYPENYKYAEDYAYFFKIMRELRVENYPEVLLDYVFSVDSISTKKRKEQVKSRIKIILYNFYFGYYPIYGLIRNSILLILSRKTVNKFKIFLSYFRLKKK